MRRLLTYNKPEWPFFVPAILGALIDGSSMPVPWSEKKSTRLEPPTIGGLYHLVFHVFFPVAKIEVCTVALVGSMDAFFLSDKETT